MQNKSKKTGNYGIKTEYLAIFFCAIACILVVCGFVLLSKKSNGENVDAANSNTTDTKTSVVSNDSPKSTENAEGASGTVTVGSEDAPSYESTTSPETTPPDTTTTPPATTPKPPVTTKPPVVVTPPTPIVRPDGIANPLPLNTKVDDSYFADAVFVGDSRTHGMALYSGVKSTYYHATSLTAQGALTKAFVNENGTNITLVEALRKHPELKKIYVSFGVNEHWMNADTFKGHYEKLIDEIMKVSPHAEIYIQALLPVSPPSTVSQSNLDRFNEKLLEIAIAKKVYFIDVSEPFVLSDGTKGLTKDISTDGVHLNTNGVKMLFDYIRTHTANY